MDISNILIINYCSMELDNADKPNIAVFYWEWTLPLRWAFCSQKPRLQGVFIHPAAAKSIYRVSSTLKTWARRTTLSKGELRFLTRWRIRSWGPSKQHAWAPVIFFSWLRIFWIALPKPHVLQAAARLSAQSLVSELLKFSQRIWDRFLKNSKLAKN